MKRRHFLSLSAASLAAVGTLPMTGFDVGADEEIDSRPRLVMPPLIDTRGTGRLALIAQAGQTSFLGGPATMTAGFNQGYLGPTIIMRNGPLMANIENRLGETITVHWHGMLVPGGQDGSAHTPIEPGQAWTVEMDIAQRPASCWYHSHAHGATARHVYFGLAGIIHQTDGRDDQRGLPSTYGVDDLTLILQDRRFDESGRMIYNPNSTDILNGFHGERMVVNGQVNAVAAVPKGIVRLRLINGSNARVYTLHFNDHRPLHVVATDGGFLAQPQAVNYLRLAPGNRAEVLIDFAEGRNPILMSASGLAMRILDFAQDDNLSARVKRVPDALDADRFLSPAPDIRTRRFSLNMGGSSLGQVKAGAGMHGGDHGVGGHGIMIGGGADGELGGTVMNDFGINGRPFDMRRIDFDVPRGSFERWVITGGGAGLEHPFHVHGVHFRVLSSGGALPRAEDSGWKDTILVSGETEILTRFDHGAGREAPYMYHCHILEHEDAGMMGQFTVS